MTKTKCYVWEAYTIDGIHMKGEILAFDKFSAEKQLGLSDLIVFQIRRKLSFHFKHKKISHHQITFFYRELATLLRAGIPLLSCIELLEKNKNQSFAGLIIQIKNDLNAGISLSQTLGKHPHYFDHGARHLIYVGEQTGSIDHMLTNIADKEEKALQLKKSIQQAMIYPGFVCLTALIMILFMLIFVVPKFADLFQNFSNKLPIFTVAIIDFSKNLQSRYDLFLYIVALLLLTFIFSHNSQKFKYGFKSLLSKLPIIRSFIQILNWIKFTGLLKVAVSCGLSIHDGLNLTFTEEDQADYKKAVRRALLEISAGVQLHKALEKSHYFQDRMIQMIKIGETSGSLENMLQKLSEFYDSDLQSSLSTFKQLLEPLIIVILGALIGGIVIAMYLPIFNLGMLT